MSHNCVLCKVLFCKSCFCGAEAEQKPNMPFSGKMCVPLNALFSRKYRCFFGAKRRTNERSERNCEAEVERLEGGRAERSQGRQSRCRERAERAKGGGRRAERDDRAKGERAERASIYRPSEAASNSAEEKCSLFVVSSPFWGAAMHPIGEETEKRRNGTEAAQFFCCHLFTNTRDRLPKQ